MFCDSKIFELFCMDFNTNNTSLKSNQIKLLYQSGEKKENIEFWTWEESYSQTMFTSSFYWFVSYLA